MEFKINEYNRNISDEELINDIKNAASIFNRQNLTIEEYDNNGRFHSSTIRRRFGTWAKALEKANLQPTRHQQYNLFFTKDNIISDIKYVYSKFGKINKILYDKNGKFGIKRLLKVFINWEEALLEAGLPLNNRSKHIKNSDLFLEIERLWIQLGKQPTSNDIKNGISKYSLNTFTRHFGSWRKALEAFVHVINNENPASESQANNILSKHIYQKNERFINLKKTKREINLRLRFLVMKRDNFKCCICGRSPANNPGLELHIDHIIPWSKGGETVIENLQTLCSDCNLGKSNYD